jgi:hypothetical protein
MIGILAGQSQLSLQRYAKGQTMLQTLFDSVTGRVNIIVQKFQFVIVPGIGDGEILRKNFVESLVLAFLRWCVQLEEILERLELYLKEIRTRHRVPYGSEINSLIISV